MKKYSIILKILSLCLVLVSGVWLGMQLQKNQIAKETAYSDSLSTTVAVVNQDLGVTVSGQTVNYANAVIETLGSDYTVVSSSVAQNGLDKGTYGAIVTFPADFSTNIVSINKTSPNQAMLNLAINPNLPEERYLALYTRLVSMQQQVNNNIAYAYVETVYEQLHSAQDEITNLLANDETDMAAVKQVTLTNYTEMLDLGDMPTVEFEPTSPDFTAFLASAQSIADDMNQVYVRSYADAQADFSVVKNQIAGYETEITTQSTSWTTNLSNWSNSVSVYAQEVLRYKQTLDGWRNTADSYRSDEELYANAVNTYATDIGAYLSTESDNLEHSHADLQTWHDDVVATLSGMTADMDAIVLDAETISNKAAELDSAVTAYNAEISNLSVWLTYLQDCKNHQDDPVTYPDEPDWPTEELPVELTSALISNEISGSVTDMNTHLTTLKATVEAEIGDVPNVYSISPFSYVFSQTAPTLPGEVPNTSTASPSQTAPTQPQELTDALTGIVTASAGYNPDAYFDDQTKSEAQQSITQYDGYLSGVESDLKSNDASNLLLLNSAYRDYNSYVGTLRTNVYDVHSREQDILSTSITGLSDTLNYTSFLNHGLMDSFVSRMPNSRINSTVNQQVVEDTVSPVTYSYNYIRGESAGAQTNISILLLIAMIALTVAILLNSLLMWRKSRKQRED